MKTLRTHQPVHRQSGEYDIIRGVQWSAFVAPGPCLAGLEALTVGADTLVSTLIS